MEIASWLYGLSGNLVPGGSGEIFRMRRKIGKAIVAFRHAPDKTAKGEPVDHADAAMTGSGELQGIDIAPPGGNRSIAKMLRRIAVRQFRVQGRRAALLELPCRQAEASKRR